jgi:hypothetical protein
VLASLLAVAACNETRRFANPNYVPTVAEPLGDGRLVLFDEAHNNTHRLSGLYAPFEEFLEANGYVVEPLRMPVHAVPLPSDAILALVLPQVPYHEDELEEIEDHVQGGGGLFAVTDHPNHPLMLQELASLFNVDLLNTNVTASSGATSFTLVPESNPISAGVPYVKTYSGSALLFSIVSNVVPVLVFGPDAFDDLGGSLEGTLRGGCRYQTNGRACFFADAQTFTSICVNSCAQNITGLQGAGAQHNEAFLRQVFAWLAGMIP